MRIPHRALVALANGEKFVLMRNVGQPFEPKLEKVQELDLELTNFSAGVRHQDPAGQRNGSTDIDELAHGAAIAEWLNDKALNGRLDHQRDDVGLADRLFLAERQRAVLVGEFAQAIRHERLARHLAHRGEHVPVADPARFQLAVHHPLAKLGGIGHFGPP